MLVVLLDLWGRVRVARAFADSLGALLPLPPCPPSTLGALLPLPPHRPSTLWQVVAAVVCLTGIAVGYAADNQLRAYMTNPNKPMLLENCHNLGESESGGRISFPPPEKNELVLSF